MTHEEGAMFYTGQAMRLPHDPRVAAHEYNDTGGIVYFADGARVSYARVDRRLSCPDWGDDPAFPSVLP